MSKKIIGVTVGTTLPKPNFEQTDPTKGDYIKNKPDFKGLKSQIDAVSSFVGGTSVSAQIKNAVERKTQVQIITEHTSETLSTFTVHKLSKEEYEQMAADGTLDDHTLYLTPDEALDLSGYATVEQLNNKSDSNHVHEDINTSIEELSVLVNNMVAQRSSVQIITWEADD